MSNSITSLFEEIESDPARTEIGFNDDIVEANNALLAAEDDEEKIITELNKWLQKNQPCLFGRLAARLNLLSFCIITEADLIQNDEYIRDKIQDARTAWTSAGYAGEKSGFIVYVSSPKISLSLPNEKLLSFSKRLCSLYLLEEIEENRIYTDEIWLEKPGSNRLTWKWDAGVNYFCTNADKRWWQDHRIPGGMAFSINSVGHMAKGGGIAKIMNGLNEMLRVTDESYLTSKVDSLGQALEFAMRTIAKASDTVSGKATELIDLSGTAHAITCPIKLPPQLEGKDYCNYKGQYHTDITIPSEYFLPDIERPKNLMDHTLDFTYMFDSNIDNPDFIRMGKGRVVKNYGKSRTSKGLRKPLVVTANPKSSKFSPKEEIIVENSRLYKAIEDRLKK
jgi:hypothetical protein